MKHAIIGVAILILIGLGAFYLLSDQATAPTPEDTPEVTDVMPVEPDNGIGDGAEALPEPEVVPPVEVIGQSAGNNPISAYHYGEGDTEVVFIGGIHSGFAPNTVAVAESLMQGLDSGAITIPENVLVTVIPNMNPDAPSAVNQLAGRLNDNGVDLNRNFDCEWNADAVWQNQDVSGGSEAFSEPEARAIRDYIQSQAPEAVVTYYAAAGGVYSSTCRNGIDPVTTDLTNAYANATGYGAFEEFDYYEITGDMVNWIAGQGIPAISVLLTDHQTNEWSKNRPGVEAVLNYFAE